MKNKRFLKFGALGTLVVGAAVALVLLAGHANNLVKVKGAVHDGDCNWNHYSAVAATYGSHGSKEFWACCTHPGDHQLTAPEQGHITDVGPWTGEAFEALTDADDRYIPVLEGGNKYASLDIIGWQDGALLYSSAQYTHIQKVTAKVRITGGEFNSWMAFGVHSTHSDWENLKDFTPGFDGEWHLVTAEVNDLDGYVNFCYNLDHVQAGTIDVDDITIITDDAIYYESFDSTPIFELDSNHAKISAEAPGNRFLREKSIEIDEELALVYSAQNYTAVTNVSYKMRIPTGCGSWGNVSVANNLGIYTDTTQAWTADGQWHAYSKDFAGVDGIVKFGHEQGHFTGPIDIDDVVITYDGGKVAIETFDDASIMQVRKPAKATIESRENSAAIGVVALDAAITSVEGREYSPSFDQSKGVDETYGAYVQLDNWKAHDTQNRTWVVMTATESMALVRQKLGAEIDSFYFYMYNPLGSDLSIQIQYEHDYTAIAYKTLAAGAWTKITVNYGTVGGHQVVDPSDIGIDRVVANNGDTVGSGFKITSIYVNPKVAPLVNPAPFGVVALDAQTGYFRDTKGYNAPHTDSHGIDDDYGAYIQIDDWACPAGANQCWITFSDTARDVADIETDLGKSISNYFFYIYNPLADSFTFKIMLKSSSGMNPNMNVACAAGAWTKVTVAYGQADSGTYPALTSASQIGLTQVLGNGVAVGSGWKVTSVYAE